MENNVIKQLNKLAEVFKVLSTIKTPVFKEGECLLDYNHDSHIQELGLDHYLTSMFLNNNGNINWKCPLCGEKFSI